MSDKELQFYNRLANELSFQSIDISSSGDTTIVTGIAGQKIIVYSIVVVVAAALNVVWKSGSTTIIGQCNLAANGGYHLESIVGITETADGDHLIINLSAGDQVGGTVTYAQVVV